MIHMHFTLEDHTIIASRDSVRWNVIVCDHKDAAAKHFKWDDQLFAAVMDLAVGGDTHDGEVQDYLYAVIEGINWGVEGDPHKFRIIP